MLFRLSVIQSTGSFSILNVGGVKLLTEKQDILERSAERINIFLIFTSSIKDETIASLPQLEIKYDLDTLPTEEEVNKTIKQMANGKGPGSDLSYQDLQNRGLALLQMMTQLFQLCGMSSWSRNFKMPV